MSDYNYSEIDPIYNLLLCEEPLYRESFDFLIEKIKEIIRKVNSIGLYAETIDTDIDRTLIDNIISNYINNNNLLNSPLKLINTIGSPIYGTRSIISFNNSDWGYKLLSPYIYDLLSIGGTPQSNLTIVYKNGSWLYVDFNSSDTTLNTPLLEYLNTSGKGNMSNTSPTFLNKDYILKYNGGNNNWSFLEYNTSEGLGTAPINLSNYTWWGKLLSGNTVTGDLKGNISKITFTKTISGTTYNVELGLDSNGNLFVQKEGGGAVDFYSFGGVSALGNSSSGGGGGNLGVVPDLNYLLDYINDNDGYSTSPTILNSLNSGDLVLLRVNNNSRFELKSLGSLSSGNGFLLKNGSTFSWGTPSGTLPSTTDQEGNYLYVNSSGLPQWTSISPGGVGGVSSIKYMVSGSSSSDTISGIGDDFTLIKGDNISWDVDTNDKSITLNVPPAGSNALGVVKPGTGLSVDNNGTLDHTNSITAAASSFGLYELKYDGQGHITDSQNLSNDIVTNNNNRYITALWPTVKSFTISEHNGTTAYGKLSVGDKRNSTTSTNGTDSIEIFLNEYLPNTITGGATQLKEYNNSTQQYVGVTRTIWGQTYVNNGIFQNVQGDLTVKLDNNSETLNGIELRPAPSNNQQNPKIYMLNRNIIDYEGVKNNVLQDHLAIGFGETGNNIKLTEIIGNEIRLTSTSGNVYIPNATSITKGLKIGDAIFYWDGKALALIKSDGTACDFYATGGVSALGLSPNSGSGSVDTMTFGEINVEEINAGQINISDQDDSYTISVDHGDLLIDGVNDIVFNKSVYNNGELHVSPTNGIYIGSSWRFVISNNNCVLQHNDGNSSTPNWKSKGTWSVS